MAGEILHLGIAPHLVERIYFLSAEVNYLYYPLKHSIFLLGAT